MNISDTLAILTTEKAIEIIIIISIVKLILSRFSPPIQESVQAIICIIVGIIASILISGDKNFFFMGIILGGIVFYGKDLFNSLKTYKNNVEDLKEELKEDIENKLNDDQNDEK